LKLELREKGSVDHELIWGGIGLAAVAASAFLPLLDLIEYTGYRCPFRFLTGLPCPTCGATRAFVAMGALRLREAFALNPLAAAFWVFTVLYVLYAFATLALGLRRVRITNVGKWERRIAVAAVCLLLTLNWAYMIRVELHSR
jgi:hypothetical protein